MLRYTADLRTIAFVTAYYGLVALALATSLPWWGGLILCVVLCLLSFFCAVITHNTVHSPVFKSRPLNRLFQLVLTPTYGHPVSAFVPGHNLSHHKYLQTPRDRMRTDKMRFRWNLLNQLLFHVVVGPIITKDNFEYIGAMKTRRPSWYRQWRAEMIAFLGFLVVTCVAAVAIWDWTGGLLRWVAFVVIPHQYAAFGIMAINFVQHDGCDAEHDYNHSRNFTGKLVNWFTFNNGFHGIHHMHPGLHWSLTPQRHAEELAPHIDPRLDQSSLLAYCWKAYIWPGKRVRFDGTPLVLGPERQDEPWVPGAVQQGAREAQDDAEYGAVA
jgi:fatty acid desaturase